ncbi:MAG: SDR family NAD(P)-dependent oxidoreductase [Candidatus Thiodiazotropha sp. (ex Dulcina madagascariensis)]|nr:SDR family NAD(P)-dependent oxidoreductase [Candidatus Thiodiazotropha sp. (ex Dulcina madagascariensis)]
MKKNLNMNSKEVVTVYPQNLPSLIAAVQESMPGRDHEAEAIIEKGGLRRDEMDSLLIRLLWGQLQIAGMFRQETDTIEGLKQKSGICKQFDRWFDESITYFVREKILSLDGELCTAVNSADIDMDALWAEWRMQARLWLQDPNMRAQVRLAEATLSTLPEILKGKVPATDILFPNSSMELVEGIYKQNEVSDYFNGILADTAVAYIKERLNRDAAAQIRLFEIGAGTGGTTARVLPRLEPYRENIAEYCYTDLSRAFLMHAEKEYGPGHPYLTYRIFNAESPVLDQGVAAGSYDLVIATNVLHATKNIRRTLRNTKAILRNNGLFLLNEINRNDLFTHLTFGLLEGWWLYEDTALRISGCPGLYPETWRDVLGWEGFDAVFFPARQAGVLGQQIIVAESNGLVRQKQKYKEYQSSGQQSKAGRNEEWPLIQSGDQINGGEVSQDILRKKSAYFLRKMVADTLKTQANKIDMSEPLEEYGIDSILVVQLTNALRKVFANVSSTLFFEYQTLDALVEYFINTQRNALIELFGLDQHDEDRQPVDSAKGNIEKSLEKTAHDTAMNQVLDRTPADRDEKSHMQPIRVDDIAVIGLSGRYPMADNVNQFWDNIKSGKNCITEIPKDRWDWQAYYSEEKGKEGSVYTKWGGFIDDIDKFDPLFFQISPVEAEKMDPQERLFLQEVHAAIEDAGYVPSDLCESGKVGVFAGVMNGTYPGEPNYWSIANRVSYFLNFRGPSMAVDSACSSSLTAIHLALESLYSGSSECAVAGGVNLVMAPSHYVRLSSMTVLSSGEVCKAYGAGADGFIDGEGVGALVLKPLRKAVADGDHIYGVIKGSMVNAGGKTNGYTVPNPTAQYQVISDALARAGKSARAISYVEGHGTGTALGDPIEIAGLTRAFSRDTGDNSFCAIGSVKSNIGHCESAAGIASITKVLLQLKHRKLVPSLHSDEPNPEIDFAKTPFTVQHQLTDWKRPLLETDDGVHEYPRCAGISSFGAGGANAHLIVEEYTPDPAMQSPSTTMARHPFIIVLSAKKETCLRAHAARLLNALQDQRFRDSDLADIAYSLQVGRDAMETRMGLMAGSLAELVERLGAFVAGREGDAELLVGSIKQNKETLSIFSADEDMEGMIDAWIAKGKYAKILEVWVKGIDIDWRRLYKNGRPRRISLPTYPFEKKQCWISPSTQEFVAPNANVNRITSHLHPLLHQNVSDFSGLRYLTTLSGDEFFLIDHKVQGNKVLPGVCYLEMVYEAIKQTAGQECMAVTLENVVWARPLIVPNEPVRVYVSLQPLENGEVVYEVYCKSKAIESGRVVYSQGRASINSVEPAPLIDLHTLKSQCEGYVLSREKCYEIYESMGIVYGPSHQGIEEVFVGTNKILARLRLPSCVSDSQDHYQLHPSLIDSALQATLGLRLGPDNNYSKLVLPFALRSIRIINQCSDTMWALISGYKKGEQNTETATVNVDLCDDQGKVCARLRGLSLRNLQSGLLNNEENGEEVDLGQIDSGMDGMLELIPAWNTFEIGEKSASHNCTANTIIINPRKSDRGRLTEIFSSGRIVELKSRHSIAEIEAVLRRHGSIDRIMWNAPSDPLSSVITDAVIDLQQPGVLQCFRIVKALLRLGYGSRELSLDVLTTQAQPVRKRDRIHPAHASIHGLCGSLVKEYPNWKIRLVDLEDDCVLPINEIINLPVDPQGDAWGYRGQEWYRQQLIRSRLSRDSGTLYMHGGVYVVVGGAGGLGAVWSDYMIRTYQAKIIWIGRRDIDEVIQSKLDALSELGPTPCYIQADATDRSSLNRAYDEIKRRFKRISGVIHSAIVLLDKSLANMDEARFRESLSAKVDISVRIAQVFSQDNLDFILFFSSMNSFSKLAGQSNYASGCTFKDAFAYGLAQELTCPVKIVNWGYWGSTGIVASKDYQERMDRAGIGSIEPLEGMRSLEALLTAPVRQVALIKTTRPNVVAKMCGDEQIVVLPRMLPLIESGRLCSVRENGGMTDSNEVVPAGDKEELSAKLRDIIITEACALLQVNPADLDPEDNLLENGFDLIALSGIVDRLNQRFALELSADVFVKQTTIDRLAKFIMEEFQEVIAIRSLGEQGGYNSVFDVNTVSPSLREKEAMDALLIRLLWAQLQSMGMFLQSEITVEGQRSKLGILKFFDRWLEESYRILAQGEYLRSVGSQWAIVDHRPVNVMEAWLKWKESKLDWLACTDMKAQVELLDVAVRALPDILIGKQRATDILFPNGSMERVEGIYKNNSVSDYFNISLCKSLIEYLEARKAHDPSVRLRIIEIGAGTGGTSSMLFSKLKPYQEHIEEYCYTDLSTAFLMHAEKVYGPSVPYLSYRIINIEEPVEKQGVELGAYDVVIAANVLHATRNIRLTVRNAKAMLARNGLIVLNELCKNTLFAHLTFGLLEGWWLYEDPTLRIRGCPGLSPQAWKHVLEEEGFMMIDFPLSDAYELGQQIITAVSDGVVQQRIPLGRTAQSSNFERERKIGEISNASAETGRIAFTKRGDQIKARVPLNEHGITDQMIKDHVRTIIAESIHEALKLGEGEIRDDQAFSECGVDSIVGVNLINIINRKANILMQTTALFEYNNVNMLVEHIFTDYKSTILSTLQACVSGSESQEMDAGCEKAHSVFDSNGQDDNAAEPVSDSVEAKGWNYPSIDVSDDKYGQRLYHRVLVERPGSIDDIKIIQSEVPLLEEHEIRISVRAYSLNFADLLCVGGLYPTMPPYPFTPGFEATGVVVSVGDAVTDVRPGDSVAAIMGEYLGAQATMIVCSEEQVFRKPDNLSYEEACAFPAVAMTGCDIFRKARLKSGERILIQTATGGVGLVAVQLAKYYGAEIFATAGSQGKLEYLRALDVAHAINYLETDFEEEVKRLTNGEGVDVVINTLSGDAIQKGMNCLASGGRYIEIAMTALKSAKSIDLSVLANNQTVYSIDLRKLGFEDPESFIELRNDTVKLIEQGIIRPTVHKIYPFHQVKEAHDCLNSRASIGKVVVSIPEEYRYREESVNAGDPVNLKTEAFSARPVLRDAIAIIGVSGKFANASNVNQLWEYLQDGEELVEQVTRWDLSDYYGSSDPANQEYCNYGSFVKGIDEFDPLFFNISGMEAEYMDPQQRLFLEESWKALEDAGYAGAGIAGSQCGVYVGCANGDYHRLVESVSPPAQSFWGNASSIIPARIAYYLNLKGPAVAVDTACSSSLVSVHLACQSLWAGEIELALAGGVFIQSTSQFYINANRAGMLSVYGHCHTFDSRADGFVPGEGVGVVVLKRLKEALADGDNIYGVIKGTGVNQDGATNGITAPSAKSQERLERQVYEEFNISAEQIQLVEAHGTGTKLGDPIEFNALSRAFSKDTGRKEFCAIGSIKTNIGHTATAAGIAGLIKVLLSLKYKKIPPSLHFEKGNPNIQFKGSPFYVNTRLRDWKVESNNKRCAAISSFGFSGTNAHMVIEEAPVVERSHSEKPGYLIVLSARTVEQLRQQAMRLVSHIEAHPQVDCGDLSFTLLLGRKHFAHRLACVARDRVDLQQLLSKWLTKGKLAQVYVSALNEKELREQPSLKRYGGQCIEQCRNLLTVNAYLEDLATIADLYVQGYALDYAGLFAGESHSRLSLPTYPFARERYWVAQDSSPLSGEATPPTGSGVLPPLLHGNGPDLVGNLVLTPVWDPVAAPRERDYPKINQRILVVGGSENHQQELMQCYSDTHVIDVRDDDGIDALVEKLAALDRVDHIFWIGPESELSGVVEESVITQQEQGVMMCFRLIKALLILDYEPLELGWTVITEGTQAVHKYDVINPTHASVHGLAGSMAKEYPNWRVRIIDLDPMEAWPLDDIVKLPPDPQGDSWGYRDKSWYRQKLLPSQLKAGENPLYRKGGVYVVIGGAGGIGEAWSQEMIKRYGANIVWIGRRAKYEQIEKKLERLSRLGPAPHYIEADATDGEALERAYEEIKQRYPRIHGVIHSAIVLLDRSLATMDESQFMAGLKAKVDVSVRLAQVFADEPLDFVLFFSSLISHTRAPGQSNYAAGTTFKDAYAQRLAQEWPCAVKVMNWGYWGSVGIVTTENYQERMRELGVGSIEMSEAMDALDTLLEGSAVRLGFINTTKPLSMNGVDYEDFLDVYPRKLPSLIQQIQARIKEPGRLPDTPGKRPSAGEAAHRQMAAN